MGVNHSTKGTETVNAINNLALITGNIGRAGAAPFSITGQCNAMGTREAGFASSLPGYRKFESADDRAELAALWNVPVERIPTARGLAYPDIIEAALDEADPRALDHRHQPDRVVPEPRRAEAGARRARVPRRAGRLSSDADLRVRATWCCRPRSGARRKAPTPTPSGASARSNRAVRPAGRGAVRLRHLPRPRRRARRARRAVSRLDDAARRVRRVAPRLGRPPLRLLGHDLRGDRAHGGIQWPFPAGATEPAGDAAPLRRRRVPDRRRPGAAAARGVGAVSRAAERRVSARAQHRPHRRALAHAHQDRQRADPRAAVAEGVGRDEPARRARAAAASRRTASTSCRGAAACAASSCASPRRSRPARCSCRSTTPRPTRTR